MAGGAVLVCEDNPVLAMDLLAMAREAGYELVVQAAGAEAALQLARTMTFEAAVLDINLADGRSGLILARELHRRGVGIILCSAETPAPDEMRDIKHIYVAKPVEGAALAACLSCLVQTSPTTSGT